MKAQEKYLLGCVKDNMNTSFGQQYNFKTIKSIADYQINVPVGDYTDHFKFIDEHISQNKAGVVSGPIKLFELSSGSTNASKLIPYTAGLKADYMAGVKPWLFDLYHTYKPLMKGKSYWSISPIHNELQRTPSGIPIGFEEDTGYFNPLQAWLFSKLFCVPSEVKHIGNIEDFRYVTALFLLAEGKLALISVWNPSFLSLLLQSLEIHKEALLKDLIQNSISPPQGTMVPKGLKKKLKVDKKRILELKIEFAKSTLDYSQIWPNLKMISCWDEGNSQGLARRLKSKFKDCELQGKGLLATEGLMTFPLTGVGTVCSYRSHFFEFIKMDNNNAENDDGKVYLLNQLEEGQIYSILLTTRGGLYRYRIYDLIQVTGFYKTLPILTFIGKEANSSDYYGEKLYEHHVKAALEVLSLKSELTFLSPIRRGNDFFYVLYIDERDGNRIMEICEKLENLLCENYHYAYARHLDQIKPIRGYIMKNNPEYAYYKALGHITDLKQGDMKYLVLNAHLNLYEFIDGELVL